MNGLEQHQYNHKVLKILQLLTESVHYKSCVRKLKFLFIRCVNQQLLNRGALKVDLSFSKKEKTKILIHEKCLKYLVYSYFGQYIIVILFYSKLEFMLYLNLNLYRFKFRAPRPLESF